ncbi:endolytic transglycosylase MltG [Streptomyces sp. MST-110588]|uniref:endolytic transglycosylase MltG n=1 Tax=Streptomyces sp. MST-110588 TaxID=2833628 RepID=UPI003242089B
MGLILKEKGVVKSADAFSQAAGESSKANSLQAGVYSLRKEMSAAAAVQLMLDPKSRSGLTVPEGLRDVAVYRLIDKKLNLSEGTTQKVAKEQAANLGLPDWAQQADDKVKDPLEGFLYPSTYEVTEKAAPKDVLRQMVQRAVQEYDKLDLAAGARKLGLKSPREVITVASLVTAEGMTHDDFRKMAEVVYNRLKPGNAETYGKLQFDSTYNYAKNQSKIDIPLSQIRKLDHPYNTYFYKGLPPGPIGNPSVDAVKASLNPTTDGWYYFISLDSKTTKFTKTYKEHQKLVEEFNERRKKG